MLAILIVMPFIASAHGVTNTTSGFGMIQTIEDEALGDDLREEMENLMEKMITGTMTEEEQSRMLELMNQYPGPHGIMMNRFLNSDAAFDSHMGMMSWGGMAYGGARTVWPWLIGLMYLVWLVVGILAIIALRQIITKGRK
ncbi:MAG: hypothetical protein COU08_02365 [Candidatus Harrisonbacteria bacterium CG10_big_fil_rev_8_21_14_0_10_42_17]|uniref:Uncharacterized protein n=1 Tax=Candidatus Harrisonbacteria bacterium CG10_big_fil_rev_8_21_14_0_10_42_17 TaxID=1974584 RepID=A0A2M6WI34_9BACT|nr:MAG: hypothetical protein COU08_02365 [Candidatus Harrisonbacteria bacterium CG10_big_fil_rev_8_21_14_0_10_42_17]